MIKLVVDASIAVKLVIDEADAADAWKLPNLYALVAPDLLTAECANILWKKTVRGEISPSIAVAAAAALENAPIALVPMRSLMRAATELSIALKHPAYDCFYVALAEANDWHFTTVNEQLMNRVEKTDRTRFASRFLSLREAVARRSS